jgi:hypothetical protein
LADEDFFIERERLQRIADALRWVLAKEAGKDLGLFLVLTDYGKDGRVQWITTLVREDGFRLVRGLVDFQDGLKKIEEKADPSKALN